MERRKEEGQRRERRARKRTRSHEEVGRFGIDKRVENTRVKGKREGWVGVEEEREEHGTTKKRVGRTERDRRVENKNKEWRRRAGMIVKVGGREERQAGKESKKEHENHGKAGWVGTDKRENGKYDEQKG